LPGNPLKPRIAKAEKVKRALEMHLHGASWDEIASAVGYANRMNAHRAVRSYLATHPIDGVDELRQSEAAKLNTLESEAWKEYRRVNWATCSRGLVLDADDNPVPDVSHREKWANTLLRIYERRARLLGLDTQPRNTAEELSEDAAIEQLIAELNANAIPAAPGHPG
jgi:hypothetical protein